MILRPYQEKAVSDIYAAFESGARRVCFTAPCGMGKTLIMAEMARLASENGTSTVILTHRDSLITQTCDKLDRIGVRYSVIAPGRSNFGDKIQVASVQTLMRRPGKYFFDFIMVDEFHRAGAAGYGKIFAEHPEAYVCGFTASPQRTDGRGLDSVADKMVLGPSTRYLIDGNYLAEPITYGPLEKLDLSGLRTVAGDYDQGQLSDLMDRPRVTGKSISEYKRLCPGEPAIAFCVSVKHAEDVAAEFREAGIKAYHVSGQMPIHDVRDRLAGLSDGRIHVLTSCDLITEGVDVPAVRAAILLRPTKSLIVYLQSAGRALRPAPGKKNALILDHAGSFARFGLVDDEREWSLEGRKKRARAGDSEAAVSVRQCPKCFFCHRPAATCPECGWVYEIAAREPDVESGELAVIDAAALRRVRQKEEREARTYKQLCDLAKRRHYSLQWPLRKWIERGGDPRLAK